MMFGLFKPKCPLDLREQVWTESRMGWLVDCWGWQQLQAADTILPTDAFFALPTDAEEVDIQKIVTDVCRYLGVSEKALRVEFAPAETLTDPTGDYIEDETALIRIADHWLEDLESLISVLANFVARHRILREAKLSEGVEDLGWRADLLATFFGMGVFGANSAVKQRAGSTGTWTWWQLHARGQMPARVFGYALALRAASRDERNPAWSRWLTTDAMETFQAGLRYLQRGGPTVFDIQTQGRLLVAESLSALAADLANGTDPQRLASLWKLTMHGPAAVAALQPVAACLHHRNRILQAEAARLIGVIGEGAISVAPELIGCLNPRERDVCCNAVTALSAMRAPLEMEGPRGETLFDELQLLLIDDDLQVIQAAALALGRYGTEAHDAAELLVEPIRRSVVSCNYMTQDVCFTVVTAIHGDVEAFLEEHFAEKHADLYPQILSALQLYRQQHLPQE